MFTHLLCKDVKRQRRLNGVKSGDPVREVRPGTERRRGAQVDRKWVIYHHHHHRLQQLDRAGVKTNMEVLLTNQEREECSAARSDVLTFWCSLLHSDSAERSVWSSQTSIPQLLQQLKSQKQREWFKKSLSLKRIDDTFMLVHQTTDSLFVFSQ